MPRARRVAYLVGLAVVGLVALLASRRQAVGRLIASFRRYSAPSAGIYESLWSRLLGGFYRQVARETADLAPAGRLLDVGSGPGHLAVALARVFPRLQIVGVDISPEMVDLAREVAQREGVGDRVAFEHGDVGALPFPDASFETVLSTFSMHHWPDPVRGLAEIHRVLKPGGVARIYDVADWIRLIERRGPAMADLAASSPLVLRQVEIVVRLGPVPLVQRAELRKYASQD